MKRDVNDAKLRLDRWLWAARHYKTRSLAAEAVGGGAVRLNNRRAKPGAGVKPGDRIRLRKGPYEIDLVVRDISTRRGPASEAAKLYEETAESRAKRKMRQLQLKNMPVSLYEGKGRPTKRDRRQIEQLRRQGPEV